MSPKAALPLLASLLALSAGCRPDADKPDPAAEADGIDEITLEANADFPTVVQVRWTSPEAGPSWVEYGLEGDEAGAATPLDAGGEDHARTVLGLKAGKTYYFQAFTQNEDGTVSRSARESLSLEQPPAGLPSLTVSDVDEAQMEPGGFVLTTIIQTKLTWAVILDRDGDYVWYYLLDNALSASTTKIGADRQSLLIVQFDKAQTSDLGGVLRLSLDGSTQVLTRTLLGHHDIAELPSGDLAWLDLEIETAPLDGVDTLIMGDGIVEAPEGATDADTPRPIYSYWTNYYDPWMVCIHMNIQPYGTGALDWTHSNSLSYEAATDRFYLGTRNHDSLLKIDHQTGDVVWQLGGLYSDFVPKDSSATWSHGHWSEVWDGGLLIFDNGFHYDPPQSRLLEIAWDEDARTYEEVWSYTEPEHIFVNSFGDARRLPNDNVLASWTTAGMLTEVTRAGEVVWRVESDVGNALGRVHWMRDLYTME